MFLSCTENKLSNKAIDQLTDRNVPCNNAAMEYKSPKILQSEDVANIKFGSTDV